MEYNVVRECKELLKSGKHINRIAALYHYPNKEPSAKKSGLICAGSQTNFMLMLKKKDLKIVSKISEA